MPTFEATAPNASTHSSAPLQFNNMHACVKVEMYEGMQCSVQQSQQVTGFIYYFPL